MDVSESVRFIVNWLIDEIGLIWSTMYNIQFLGTNLLVYTVTITVLGALGTVIITKAQETTVHADRRQGRAKAVERKK